MQEEFLHFIWRYRLLSNLPLITSLGMEVVVHKPGDLNTNAGPDFSNGHVSIGDFSWHGDIEIHLKSSDWILHNHHHDKAYDQVVLHVVYENDQEIYLKKPGDLPVVELRSHIDLKYLENYKSLRERKLDRPCKWELPEISEVIWINWKDRLLVARLEKKCVRIEVLLSRYKNNWNYVAWLMLCRSMGLKVNQNAFEFLADAVPSAILCGCANSTFQLEALLFGQAALLPEEPKSPYESAIVNEYVFLRHKFKLIPLSSSTWKKLRMRPSNFPEIRIAQLAVFARQNIDCMSVFLEVQSLAKLIEVLRVTASSYWDDHYSFGKPSVHKPKKMGLATAHSIVVNAVVPMLFYYAKMRSNEAIAEKAFRFLQELPSEKNTVLQDWKNDGIVANSAADSQALLELKNEFCDSKKCLSCMIGTKLLKRQD
jgi:hypothetical protein